MFGGTWTRIKDKFILAAGDSYAQGATGGSATVTLTTAQLPAHNHSGSANSNGDHSHSASSNSAGSHSHTIKATNRDDSSYQRLVSYGLYPMNAQNLNIHIIKLIQINQK